MLICFIPLMSDLIPQIQELATNLTQTEAILNLPEKKNKLAQLETQMSVPNFWDNQNQARQTSQTAADLSTEIKTFETLRQEINELQELATEIENSNDNFFEKELNQKIQELQSKFVQLKSQTLLSGKYNSNNAVISIHAGAGGTDAQDWTQMLERMYLRYAETQNFQVNILDCQSGSEAGLKSVSFEIIGKWAYGYLQGEAGVHRLVRISPFDAEALRHTSFALVEVLPELEETPEIELNDDDLEIDTFKSSGHGGQSVNTTDSAIRIKHLPTGLTVTCQNERSQLQNKTTALKILKSKLQQYNEAEAEEERQRLRGEFSEAAWGNQIRSYVLHPYQQVKDHRTDYETPAVNQILDGQLDELITAYLNWKAKNK